MNGSFFLNVLRAVIIAAILAVATTLWTLNRQVAVLEERVSQVLAHSDKRDSEFDVKLSRIEQRLDDIKRGMTIK